MFKQLDTQGTLSKTIVNDYLLTWLEAFMIDRKAQGVSEGTLHFYKVKFKSFIRYCEYEHIKYVQQIKPISIREYLLWLEVAGHNPGGRHAHYRAIRSFLYWYEDEVEPIDWKEPVSIETINCLISPTGWQKMRICSFLMMRSVLKFLFYKQRPMSAVIQ